jgi:hypothetical protein
MLPEPAVILRRRQSARTTPAASLSERDDGRLP